MQKREEHSNSGGHPSVAKIPIEIPVTNQIYVQAGMNDSAPMWFVFDTGSTWTFLDASKAKQLNITTVYRNLTRNLVLSNINQLWVADITYIRLLRDFIYLAVLLDAFSRCIGWAIWPHRHAADFGCLADGAAHPHH